MESTGRDGRRGPWNYYLKETGSNSYTSSSGTVSTGYTTSAYSRLSSMSMEAARHFQEMEMEEAVMDLEFVQSSKETASGEKIQEMEADRQIQELEMKDHEFVLPPNSLAGLHSTIHKTRAFPCESHSLLGTTHAATSLQSAVRN